MRHWEMVRPVVYVRQFLIHQMKESFIWMVRSKDIEWLEARNWAYWPTLIDGCSFLLGSMPFRNSCLTFAALKSSITPSTACLWYLNSVLSSLSRADGSTFLFDNGRFSPCFVPLSYSITKVGDAFVVEPSGYVNKMHASKLCLLCVVISDKLLRVNNGPTWRRLIMQDHGEVIGLRWLFESQISSGQSLGLRSQI